FEEDRNTTRAVVVVPGQGDAVVEKLAALVQRDPRAVEARVQLASLAMGGGRRELGDQLYHAALTGLATGSQQYRTIVWNYGWDLLKQGDAEQALQQWLQIINGRPATPDWVPQTLALALWRLDRKSEAVEWYGAAVRTWPDRWANAANLASAAPTWREEDRNTLAEIATAYASNPPAWP
ncbi:MAG TPA: tetratricopeptide repeat protein, partial [Stenotrophomonas sp.]